MLAVFSLALGAPVQEATRALMALGPHTAHYDKVSTGEPVLEVTVRGPREAIARAYTPEGTVEVAVDATHMRLRLDATTCASIDARTLFTQASAAAGGHHRRQGPPGSQLIYRVRPDGSLDLSTAFETDPDPPVLSWIADLERDGVQVTTDEDGWVATSSTSTWKIARETGLLTRMTVEDDALQLRTVQKAGNEPLPTAKSVCPSTTALPLGRSLASQLRVYASIEPLAAVAAAWPDLEQAARGKVVGLQHTWWKQFFAEDMPGWIASLEQGDWKQRMVADMADVGAFRTFEAQVPAAEKDRAVEHWKQAWFARVGRDLVTGHVREVQQVLLQGLAEQGTKLPPEVFEPLLAAPLLDAGLRVAEPLLREPLVPVVEAGGEALRESLAAKAGE